ncbi:MAG: phenylalanine--tRNA ligase subunit beta [Nanoarchaeota archaeon]|nr:phenylalanine--tRNA ligase subunit beta [Nanoarchaeota archaeon]
MPSVKLNKEVFEKLVGKRLPLEELKDRISMLGTDLEGIEGNEINVEVFPNRPDMLSEQGFARAFSSFIGVKTGLRKYEIKRPEKDFVVTIDKSVSDVRPFTACAVVKGIKFDDEKIREIIQMQEKLHVTYGRNRKKAAIGIYPLEKIKLPIRFIGKNPKDVTFRPLESPKEIRADDILELHPTGREYAHLLEGMGKFPFFIDANNQVLSMPPIINSHVTGKVGEKTTDVFIECSGFDFQTLSTCLNMIVTAMADMGGTVYSMTLRYPGGERTTPDLAPSTMLLDTDYANKRLGLELESEEIAKLLEKMGYGIEKAKDKQKLSVLVPAYRADVMHPVDLVEDISIAYGYENFEEELPEVATVGEEAPFERFKKRIANIMIGFGLLETNTYHLSNADDQCKRMNCDIKVIPLANALTEEYDVIRAWMIPSLLRVLSGNKHHDYPQNIFEMGTIFKEDKSAETGIAENDRLAVLLCGADADFTKIKQVFQGLMDALDLKYETKDAEHDSFIPGRAGRISVKGKDVAYIGELHPKVISNFGLEMPVACFELNLSELYSLF